jgi:hypothetical protein
MGCWNGTCALTNMPIHYGERIVLIPLSIQEEKLGTMCYHNELCHYAGYPIRGTYDDYGGIEDIDETSGVKRTLELFQSWFKTKKITLNSKAQDNYGKGITELSDIGVLLHVIERGGLEAEGCLFSYIMMHEKAFDAIVNEMGSRTGYKGEEAFRDFIKRQLGGSYKKQNREKDLKEKIKIDSSDNALMSELFLSSMSHERYLYTNFFYRNFFCHTDDHILTEELESSFVELYLFDCAMAFLRKTLIPQCGAGSQQSEYYLHKLLAQFVIEKEAEVGDGDSKETLFLRDWSL